MDRLPAGRPQLGRMARALLATAQGPLAQPAARAPVRRRPRARPPTARARSRAHTRPRWMRALLAGLEVAQALLGEVWRRRRLRIALLIASALGAVGGGGWLWVRHSSLVAVRQVRISGVHGPEARAIDAALTAAARRMSTLDLKPAALRAAVAPFRVVREVHASASFPHGLRIRVVEQLPVAALAAAGTRTAVTEDGVVLGPALLSGSLPTLNSPTAPGTGAQVQGGWLAEALRVLGAAPRALAKLTSRAYSGHEGLTVTLRDGVRVYFGDGSRAHAKWVALALVLASERGAGAAYVDVRVPERPAAGFRAGMAPPAASATGTSGPATVHSLAEATIAALSAGLPAEGSGKAPSGSAAAEEEEGIKPRATEGTREGTREGSREGARESNRESAAEGTASPRSEGAASPRSEGH